MQQQLPAGDHHLVASGDHHLVMQLLLAAGANVDTAAADNVWTPFHAATDRGRLHLVKLLLAAGANVDALCRRCRTPLFAAATAASSSVELTQLLLSQGANPKARDVDGRTPLAAAAA
jgi:ankyrin repeat protein